MKTIVVPTDFSVSAERALQYAAGLAERLSASLLLVHAYQIPVSMNDMPVLLVSAEELKKQAESGLERSRDQVLRAFPGLQVRTESLLGDLNDELRELCRKDPPFLIVMGHGRARGMEKILFGSTALSLIRKSRFPVLVVPEGARPGTLRQAALASDLSQNSGFPYDRITELVQALGVRLHIIHVCTSHEERVSVDALKARFAALNPECHLVHDDQFVHGIQDYLRNHTIDLLITVPHHHSFLERLIFRTHTVELVEELQFPILCVNEEK